MKHLCVLMSSVFLASHAHAAQPEPIRIRVLTYNIASGAGIKLDLTRTAKVISDQKPDLVALQEVDNKTRRHGKVEQAAELGRLTGMHSAFGKAMNLQGGEYGDAVLSRYPLIETKTHALTTPSNREPRVALEARLRIGDTGPEIIFLGTHLANEDETTRVAQAKSINELLGSLMKFPVILAGDFNTTPGADAYRALQPHWTIATDGDKQATWPADNPRVKIDHIWFRPADRFRVVETHVIDERIASDHRPVLSVLELLP